MAGEQPITYVESHRQVRRLLAAAEQASRTASAEEAIEAWQAVLDHPCTYHQLIEHEILDELFQQLRNAERYDEAIEVKRRAIAAGYRSVPDPEADIAECLVAMGRREEGDRLYAELRQRDPDDVWLNNSASFAYDGVDDREALRWSLDGIDLAIATGDHDQIIGQLLDHARRAWGALGESPDQAVVERVEAFERTWTRPPYKSRWGAPERIEQHRCDHCGWDPDAPAPEAALSSLRLDGPPPAFELAGVPGARSTVGSGSGTSGGEGKRSVAVAIAWFPAEEWPAAVERWPGLLDELPEDHLAYSHETEARIKRLAKGLTRSEMAVGVLTVDGLIAFAEEQGEDPSTGDARSHFAAEQLRRGEAVPWPPGRNDPCWCGSGHKYKRCCGPVPALPLD